MRINYYNKKWIIYYRVISDSSGFDSLCTRDMRIYAQANDGNVFHYRDKSELEADIIVRLGIENGGFYSIRLPHTERPLSSRPVSSIVRVWFSQSCPGKTNKSRTVSWPIFNVTD